MSTHFSLMTDFGARLRAIRMVILNMSRQEFSNKFDIPEITVRAWETGKTNITKLSLEKLVKRLRSEQIAVSEEWLLSGKGISPFSTLNIEKRDLCEKDIFLSNNLGSIILEIADSSYEPLFGRGDIVGGTPTDISMLKNYGLVLIDTNNKQKEIKRSVFTDDKKLIFIPVYLNNHLELAISHKPSI